MMTILIILLIITILIYISAFRMLYILEWRIVLIVDDFDNYLKLPSPWRMLFSFKPLKYWIK